MSSFQDRDGLQGWLAVFVYLIFFFLFYPVFAFLAIVNANE